MMRGAQPETCPVRALRAWLRTAEITEGPVFRRVTQWNTVGAKHLHPDAVRQSLLTRAAAAGVTGTTLEPVTPHGLRTGFVTTAYRNGVSDKEIMGHPRHCSLTTMRSYVRRAKLGGVSPPCKLDL